MSRRIEHGRITRAWKWGLPIGWRADGADSDTPKAAEPEPTTPPATAPPIAPDRDMRRVDGTDRLATDRERAALRVTTEPDRPPLEFGEPLDTTVAPERIWPAPLPEEHQVFTPHCDGRHGPREEADERCVWCDVLTELASVLHETRRRVTALEARADALAASIAERRARS